MVLPLRFETARYASTPESGGYSKSGEFVYDHPFQWGSKRTGPDLAREGGLRSNSWHYNHMIRPKDVSPGSVMPAYPWMRDNDLDVSLLEKKIRAMQTLGVPYAIGYDKIALKDLETQAERIAKDVVNNLPKEVLASINKDEEVNKLKKKEVIAMIAYLQRLGMDIKADVASKNTQK
jgi:cytochrome c oxidase cbb3-type subunit I/II